MITHRNVKQNGTDQRYEHQDTYDIHVKMVALLHTNRLTLCMCLYSKNCTYFEYLGYCINLIKG